MNLTSLGFLLFLACSLGLYYGVSPRFRPGILIAVSFFFIATYDLRGIAFLLATSLVLWRCGLALQTADASGAEEAVRKARKKRVLILGVVVVSSVLILLKYLGPLALQAFAPSSAFRFFMPIGISYYTLQALSYLIDVYWNRIPAEKQYGKLLLFLSYFPQILQGPISRYQDLSAQLYEKEHRFQLHNLKYGLQMILWGYFKLAVIGDKVHLFVIDAFHSHATAYGWAVLFGLVMFGFDLYANFSGGIDVIRGVSQCFDIALPENFRQPFLSRSLGEFWRRWHITLGAWMKDYIFYPISMSHSFSRLKKSLKKRVSRRMANRIPMALANILVFVLVGVWHGLGSNYLLWGLYNGLILAFSEVMADCYLKAKQGLHIGPDNKLWSAFALVRTFLIITIGWCTDCSDTALGSLQILGNLFRFHLTDFGIFSTTLIGYAKAFFGLIVMIAVDLIHEKGYSVRSAMERRPFVLQVLFWTALIQLIACFGRSVTLGGLMYAGF